MEKVDRLGDGVLDDHAPGIAVDQPGGRFALLVGEQQGGLAVAEIRDGELADRAGIVLEGGWLVEEARVAVGAPDVVERDSLPLRVRRGGDGSEQLGAASAQGDEADAELVEAREVGVSGQLGVEDQLAGSGAGALLPVLGEAQDLVLLGVVAKRAVGIAEQARLVVAGDEGEDALLAARTLGQVMLFGQGVFAMVGDGVEVEVEAVAAGDTGLVRGVGPGAHQVRQGAVVDAAAVLGERGALGEGVEAGEQGEAAVEDLGHGLGRPADAPQADY